MGANTIATQNVTQEMLSFGGLAYFKFNKSAQVNTSTDRQTAGKNAVKKVMHTYFGNDILLESKTPETLVKNCMFLFI